MASAPAAVVFSLACAGSDDAYIAKYNSAGVVQWVARQAGTGSDIAYGVTADSAGNVIVAGYYASSPLTIYNADGSQFGTTLARTGATGNDAFIAKYNAAGVVQWVARQAGTGSDYVNAVTADSSGNVIVAGDYNSALTIYNANGTAFGTTLANSGGYDAFIAKYNAAGVVQWVARQAGTGSDIAYGVTADSAGNVIVAGQYASSPLTIYNADGSQFVTTLAYTGGTGNDAFIAKYNAAGVVQWVARQAGTGPDGANAVTADSSGNVIVAGYYTSNPLTIYSADGSQFGTTLAFTGGFDSYIAKYNAAGVVQWVARQAGTGSDFANAVTVDSSGNVIVAGYYTSALTIYSADGSQFGTTLAFTGGSGAFIAKYNAAGVVQWVARQAGTGSDYVNAVTADSSGNVIVAGQYSSNPLTIYNA